MRARIFICIMHIILKLYYITYGECKHNYSLSYQLINYTQMSAMPFFLKKRGQRSVSMLAAEYWCVFWQYVFLARICCNVKESKCFMKALTNESTSWWVWKTSHIFSIKDCFFTNTYFGFFRNRNLQSLLEIVQHFYLNKIFWK